MEQTGWGDNKLTARVVACLLLAGVVSAHDTPTTKLTWTREISRIVAQRCAGCHQPGGMAPFSLLSFAQARPWAVAIKEEVLQRRMPPWPAAKGFGDFVNDVSLPQEEINRLAEWAEGGAPEGEPQYLRRDFSVPLWRPAARPAGRGVRLTGRVAAAVTVLAVRPLETRGGKAWAEMPGGGASPLAWLTGAGKKQWLVFREPVRLPAGAVIRGPALEAVIR